MARAVRHSDYDNGQRSFTAEAIRAASSFEGSLRRAVLRSRRAATPAKDARRGPGLPGAIWWVALLVTLNWLLT